MQTWIFQGNPDEYDIDAYLASRPAQVVWLVSRYAKEIDVGDRVYFWRNQGSRKAVPGIIAEGIVTAAPELRGEDPQGIQFWRTEGPRASAPQVRAVMRLVKVATSREVLRRDWCLEDPVLRDLANLKMQAGTNYRLTPEHAARLDALWTRTGRDWTRNESLAGLWAYAQTFGQPVSRLPGSPVATMALTIGRAVSGVYAKVMNFRSLDPRVPGEGMSGAGEADRAVWGEFYDATAALIQTAALRSEFDRVWGGTLTDKPPYAEASATAAITTDEADRLEELMLDQLLAKYEAQTAVQPQRPAIRILSARAYDRNPLVIAIARLRASHCCEVPGCTHPAFETADRVQYTEVHHIVPLAAGGEDTIDNVACLCPSHHREVHLGVRAAELSARLMAIRSEQPPISEQLR
ncbi:HNH endonuclease [Bradyrhizobium erythrophlei]|uniref:EVE domain-containing protein n=1 Tax=Bradyrhizobium erythrophlei TaxID=1437360 RepID=A0A1M5YJ49_9BRAD|nr:HNH endonuclease [Bradyrhizobium erythrophlei]SHI12036.1 EVE domain-containing protein [Bradyrhizobium erythrophlei]